MDAVSRLDGTHRWWRHRAIAVALTAALAAALLAPIQQEIISLLPRGRELPAGARVIGTLPVADALVVSASSVPPGAVATATQMSWRSLGGQAGAGTGAPLDSGVASTGAPQVWQETTRGEGALVALVDTGVTAVRATADALVAELDFTHSGGGDGYGHGTYLASLIAGRTQTAPGVAPAAGILSLKVATADGGADLGTVLTALQWLSGPGRDAGVTVATMALGVDASSPAGYLLDMAVGRLAAEGVLVVTAAGNDPSAPTSPATAPGTFSAGAVDDQGTPDRADDEMADFSPSGVDRWGDPAPDVVASGTRVVGWMPCAAQIAVDHPAGLVGDGAERCAAGADSALFRGSGTSMAAALTAGVAALASSANADLDGRGLDAALRAWDPAGDPAGLHAPALDAPSAVAAAMTTPGGGGGHDTGGADDPAHPTRADASPEPAPFSAQGVNWRGQDWQGVNWRESDWQGVNWRGVNWRDNDWQGVNWRGVNWRGVNWRDSDWQGVNWRGVNWRENNWQGVNWRATEW